MIQLNGISQIVIDIKSNHTYITEDDMNEAKPFLGLKHLTLHISHHNIIMISACNYGKAMSQLTRCSTETKGIQSPASSVSKEDQIELINLAKKWSHYFARHYPVMEESMKLQQSFD